MRATHPLTAPHGAARLRRSAARLCWAFALGALAAVASPAVRGQIPGLTGAAKPAAADAATAPQPPEPDEQRRARLVTQLEQVNAQRERFAGDLPPPGTPPGLDPEELSAARNVLGQLAVAIEGQLRTIDEQQGALAARQEAEKGNREWTGFATAPPYSMLLVDDLNDSIEATQTRLGALAAQREIAGREAERLLEEAQRSEAALRRARESAALAGADDQAPRRWRAQVAEWSSAAAAAKAGLVQRGLALIDEQIVAERERLKLAERKLEIASGNARFSAEDLAQVRRGQEVRLGRLRGERAKAAEQVGRWERELASAADALRLLEADSSAQAPALAIARARLRSAQTSVDSAKFEVEMLDSLASVIRVSEELYVARQQALTEGDAERRREATLRLRQAGARVRPWRAYAQSQLDLLRASERESGALPERPDDPPQLRAYEAVARDALRQRAASAQRLLDAAERSVRTVNRWLAEIEDAQGARPLGERLASAWATARDWAKTAWNFELFAVEDTLEVGGQKITSSRGVTVGKSVGALLLFVVGYWLAARLARYFERLLISRFAMEPAQARTVRRWVLALWSFVLLALTLNLARIPLTVFAFLGGALAIGVGFGTQTIIRNFISGLIVLMERQVKVGDIIDVDGVTGTVTEVNLRSSTVRGFDGVEAIIPNSNLLENRVTNWTHADNRVRRVVKVGVAYGSPVRKVSDLLLECLHRHGQVLKEPEPQVLFEDFGDSALVFGMYFWLEMRPGIAATVVMSDLRFMALKALDEAGVGVPFPQRDVHLDVVRPLQVEVLPGRPAASG